MVSTHATLRVATTPDGVPPVQIDVSTHATLRVATWEVTNEYFGRFVSTHATLRVATYPIWVMLSQYPFQLTRPCGSRPKPASMPPPAIRFQLTRPCGSRRETCQRFTCRNVFQLTRPCGSRHLFTASCDSFGCFNSRDPAGRDFFDSRFV